MTDFDKGVAEGLRRAAESCKRVANVFIEEGTERGGMLAGYFSLQALEFECTADGIDGPDYP